MILQASDAESYGIRTLYYSEPFARATALDGWEAEYMQLSTGRYEGKLQEVRCNELQIGIKSWNTTLHNRGAAWTDSFVFAIPCEMGSEGRIYGRRWSGEICAFRCENGFDALLPPMKLMIVSISRDTLAEYLSIVEHVSIQEWLRKGMLLIEDPVRAAFAVEALTTLVDGCCKDSSMIAFPQARAAVVQTTLAILAPLILDNLASPPFDFSAFNRTQIVSRAREFALANIDEPLQIIDICRALGVSRRALQYSFQDVLNINPLTYLRLIKLNGARRDLVGTGENILQVQDVIARWGFWHFSRFSAEYKKMYNELPSETLRRTQLCAKSP